MRPSITITIAALVAGCGGGSQPEPGSIPVDELRASFRDAWCSYLVRCGELPDLATCAHARLHPPFPVARTEIAAVLAGRAHFDADAAAQCFAQISGATCDRTDADLRSAGSESSTNPAACDAIVRGTVSTGGRCSVSAECASTACDLSAPDCSSGCCTGSCLAPPAPLAPGDTCAPEHDTCADGICRRASAPGRSTCGPLIARGEVCRVGAPNECELGLGCVIASSAMMCQPLPVIGQACPGGACRDDGSVCATSGSCAAAGLAGAACVTNADCSSYYACDGTGHCAPLLESASCSGAPHGGCFDEGLVCPQGHCVPALAEGGSCSALTGRLDAFCASGQCDPEDGPRSGDPRIGVCAGDVVAACY